VSFPEYPEYREQDSPLLGQLPAHWSVRPLKRCLSRLTEVRSVPDNPVTLEEIESWSGRRLDADDYENTEGIHFQEGDLLFGKLRPYLAKVYRADKSGVAVGDFHVMRPGPDTISRYAFYYLLREECVYWANSAAYGAKMPRVGWDFMGQIPFPLPPANEQKTIADFLDHETARIDALIEEQQRLIELLDEKRKEIVFHYVSNGLDSERQLKDSGTDWLGSIPDEWNITRLTWIAVDQNAGEVIDRGYWGKGNELLYTCAKEPLWSDFGEFPDDRRTSERDLLLTRNGTPYIHEPVDGAIYTNVVQRVRLPRSGNRRFVKFALQAASRSLVGYGVSIQSLNYQMWKALYLPYPPPCEQTRIVSTIDENHRELDALLAETENLVSTLRERRSALISAAVTGKIDVRKWSEQPRYSGKRLQEAAEEEGRYG